MRNDIKPYHDNNGFYIKGIYLKLKMFIEWNFSENKERRLIKAS